MEFIGKLIRISEKEYQGKYDCPIVRFIVEEHGDVEYPSRLSLKLIRGDTKLIEDYRVGDVVKIGVVSQHPDNYDDRRYNNLKVNRIEDITPDTCTNRWIIAKFKDCRHTDPNGTVEPSPQNFTLNEIIQLSKKAETRQEIMNIINKYQLDNPKADAQVCTMCIDILNNL